MNIELDRLAGSFAVARLDPGAGWPHWATWSRGFLSITRSETETSVVCADDLVPRNVRAERDFAAYAVRGPLPFSAVGILSRLTAPLADARIPLLAVSTFDTDVLLVRATLEVPARAAWRDAGFVIHDG